MEPSMSAYKRLWAALGAWLVTLSVVAALATASSFTTLYNEYRQTGSISPCKHSAAELQSAVSQVPPDIAQYAPDFPAALQAALQARARGACGGAAGAATPLAAQTPGAPPGGAAGGGGGARGSSATGGSTPLGVGSSATPSIANVVATTHANGAATAPAPVIVLAILTGALALAALWWLVASLRGRDPRWLGPARHALAEAGFRAEGALEEFGDWLRLGR
jgi:hypothetical protein